MIWLAAIVGYFLITAVIIVAVCALSARMSQHEDWGETPLVEARMETNAAREYQTDAAPSS